jgi:hypothetical protein
VGFNSSNAAAQSISPAFASSRFEVAQSHVSRGFLDLFIKLIKQKIGPLEMHNRTEINWYRYLCLLALSSTSGYTHNLAIRGIKE